MSKVVAKKQETSVSKETVSRSWGNDQNIDQSDISIARIFCLSANSKISQKDPKNYPAGSIVRSTDKKVLGDGDKGVAFIPFMTFKNWKIEVKRGNKFEHVRFEPHTPENAQRPWEYVDTETKEEYRANANLGFFCLLVDDIEDELAAIKEFEKTGDIDPDRAMLPVCITFNRSAYNIGKTLTTHFSKCQSFGVNPAVTTFELSTFLQSKDDNNWHSLDVKKVGKSAPEHVASCKKWFDIVAKASNVNLHDEDEKSDNEEVSDTTPVDPEYNNDF